MSLFLQDPYTVFKQPDISSEFIDDQPLNTGSFIRFEQIECTDELCEHTSPVYISYQEYRCIRHPGKSHINYVILLQIDFSGRPGSFDNNDIGHAGEFLICSHYFRDQLLLVPEILGGTHIAQGDAVYYDLRSLIVSGFKENGIHAYERFSLAASGLHYLSSPHLQTFTRDV